MYPFHCHSVACAGINPSTLENVCRMPLHKFRTNCTCTSCDADTSSPRGVFPFCISLISFLSSSLIFFNFTVLSCCRSVPRTFSTLPEGRYIYLLLPLPPFLSLSTRAFGDHCALQRPIIPMQAEFKEVNSGANVFTPFYLNPRRFRMYCQFCIYTRACPPTPAQPRAVHE